MSIRMINSCKKTHRLDGEKIVQHILERIPTKFLVGLNEVHVFDSIEEEPDIKYIPRSTASKYSVIEINMENPALSGMPFFSILTLNIMFILAINDHIEKSLQHDSEDKEILSYPTGRVNYDWMHLGIWNPLLMLFKAANYIISKISLLRKIPLYFINRASREYEKRKPQ